MLDFEKYTKAGMDRIWKQMNLDDSLYSDRFRNFVRWWGYKAIPTILSIASIIVLFVIAFRFYDRAGFEKTMIFLAVILIIVGKSIANKLS